MVNILDSIGWFHRLHSSHLARPIDCMNLKVRISPSPDSMWCAVRAALWMRMRACALRLARRISPTERGMGCSNVPSSPNPTEKFYRRFFWVIWALEITLLGWRPAIIIFRAWFVQITQFYIFHISWFGKSGRPDFHIPWFSQKSGRPDFVLSYHHQEEAIMITWLLARIHSTNNKVTSWQIRL